MYNPALNTQLRMAALGTGPGPTHRPHAHRGRPLSYPPSVDRTHGITQAREFRDYHEGVPMEQENFQGGWYVSRGDGTFDYVQPQRIQQPGYIEYRSYPLQSMGRNPGEFYPGNMPPPPSGLPVGQSTWATQPKAYAQNMPIFEPPTQAPGGGYHEDPAAQWNESGGDSRGGPGMAAIQPHANPGTLPTDRPAPRNLAGEVLGASRLYPIPRTAGRTAAEQRYRSEPEPDDHSLSNEGSEEDYIAFEPGSSTQNGGANPAEVPPRSGADTPLPQDLLDEEEEDDGSANNDDGRVDKMSTIYEGTELSDRPGKPLFFFPPLDPKRTANKIVLERASQEAQDMNWQEWHEYTSLHPRTFGKSSNKPKGVPGFRRGKYSELFAASDYGQYMYGRYEKWEQLQEEAREKWGKEDKMLRVSPGYRNEINDRWDGLEYYDDGHRKEKDPVATRLKKMHM